MKIKQKKPRMIILYEHDGFKLVRAEQGKRWHWEKPLPSPAFGTALTMRTLTSAASRKKPSSA